MMKKALVGRKPAARKSAAGRSGTKRPRARKRVAKRVAATKAAAKLAKAAAKKAARVAAKKAKAAAKKAARVTAKEKRAARESEIGDRYDTLNSSFTERARRLFVANEAIVFGYGGIVAAARATGMAPSVIGNGIREVRAIEAGTAPSLAVTRSRRPGGGRKKTTDKDPTLLPDLKALVESTTRGDPESSLLWTARSQRNIVAALKKQGHQTNKNVVARLLKQLGYSLQANRKRLEGAQHPDRNAQFEHINETIRRQHEANEPVISVDTKKKELVGNFKNGGRELRANGDSDDVKVHDFIDPEQGRAAPYGVYDLQENEAWVSVGLSHDTGEFAVQTIRTWWKEMGASRYPDASSLTNGRRWRKQWLPTALVEARATGTCRRAGLPDHCLSSATGDEQMEQDRAPPVLVHHQELAWQAARHPSGHREFDRRHHDDDGPRRTKSYRRSHLSQGPSRFEQATRTREPRATRLPRRVELHHPPDHGMTRSDCFGTVPKYADLINVIASLVFPSRTATNDQ